MGIVSERSTADPRLDEAPAVAAQPPTAERSRSAGRIRGVEGLRALAATSILVYHVWLYGSPTGDPPNLGPFNRFVAPHLPVGVTLFFTLSGFLLYRPIVAAVIARRNLPDVRSYFTNRALRIVPAYWVILLVTAVVLPAGNVRMSPTTVGLGRLTSHPWELIANSLLLQNYFRGSMDSGIGPAWSLAVEVVFYLTLPALGLLAVAIAGRSSRTARRTLAVVVPAVLMYCLGVGTSILTDHIDRTTAAYAVLIRAFLNHADLFAFGMLLAVLTTHVIGGTLALPRHWALPTGIALVGLVAITIVLTDRGMVLTFQGAVPYETLTSIAATLLLALIVLPRPDGAIPVLTRIFDSRALVATGLISYSVFLWHEPLIHWLDGLGLTFAGGVGFAVNLVILSAITAALSAVTYRFVERPALAHKRRSSQRDSERTNQPGDHIAA